MELLKSFQNLYNIVVPIITLLYPLYATIMAIESPTWFDGRQWLTYWVLYSFTTLFELSCWRIIQWLPFWPYLKQVGLCWLVLPAFNGAAYIYQNLVTKILFKVNDKKSSKEVSYFDTFVEKYGWDGLQRALKQGERKGRESFNIDDDHDDIYVPHSKNSGRETVQLDQNEEEED